MVRFLHNMCITFAAGCAGGLANSIVVWLFGFLGITTGLGVKIAPALTPLWLYPRIVWGGLWGFLFLFPFFKKPYIYQGVLYSLGPTLIQLLVVFPVKANKGLLGLDLGNLTPLFVIFFNLIWGIKTSYLIKIAKNDI